MKRWITTNITGTGISTKDGYRPDLKGIAIQSMSMTAYNDKEAQVLVEGTQEALDELSKQPGVTHHGDESLEPAYSYEVVTQEAVYEPFDKVIVVGKDKPTEPGAVEAVLVSPEVRETRYSDQMVWKRSEQLEAALKDEAKRLGAGDDWHPCGYGVGG